MKRRQRKWIMQNELQKDKAKESKGMIKILIQRFFFYHIYLQKTITERKHETSGKKFR